MSLLTQQTRRTRTPGLTLEMPSARTLWIVAGCVTMLLLSLPWVFSPDGKTHGNWQQFLGRFHPLAVHLPIGFLLLVPVLEIGGRFRPALREAAAIVLRCAVVCSVAAVVLGMLLAHGGGFTHEAVRGHMWAGLFLTFAVFISALIRPSWVSGRNSWLYPTLLVSVLLLTAWTGHQGGALTYGKTYLTEFAPAFIKQLGPQKIYPPVDPASVYATRIQPILDSNCLSCHSASKIKGGLQLDTFAHLMDGGNGGEVIIPLHSEKSVLLTRISLSVDHSKFMPSEGKPLAAKDIATIKAWVQQGASPAATTLAGMETFVAHVSDPIPQVSDYSALTSQITQIEKSLGVRLDHVSARPADGLVLRTIDVAHTFNDADLAKLEPFAPYIVDAELGHTRVTDACFETLAKLKHARAIHLEDTAITGHDLAKLAALSELRYLNLSSTRVTRQTLDQMSSMKTVQHLYAFDTPAQPATGPVQ
jgi:uncharacterized membrane protein